MFKPGGNSKKYLRKNLNQHQMLDEEFDFGLKIIRMKVPSIFIKKYCLNMNLSFFPLCFFNINHLHSWKTFL